MEILASSFIEGGDCDGGALYAFVLTGEDFRESDSWTRNVLADGFTFDGISCANRQTPGHQEVFYPST